MAKRIKIAKRHHELPTPYNPNVLSEMWDQTARGSAIVGTAYLDLLLRAALETRMRRDDDEAVASLFENRGPLQDFSARIKLAYALQIIGHGAYADLCIMRDIRNAFAHTPEALDLNREDIANMCRDLWYQRTINYRSKPKPKTPREMFEREVEVLAEALYSVIHKRLNDTFAHLGPAPSVALQSSQKKPKQRASRGPKAPTRKT